MALTPSSTNVQLSAASNTANLVSSSFTPAVNDVIVVKVITEDFTKTMTAPTDTQGNTYLQRNVGVTSSECWVSIWTTLASAATANIITVGGWSGAAGWHSAAFEYWPAATCKLAASPAVNATKTGTGAPSTTLTTAANGSIVSWANGDWAANAPGSRAYRSSATEVGIHDKSTTIYVGYFAYQQAATAGSQTLGLTLPTGQTWCLLGVEVQAQSGASFTHTPTDNEGLTDTVTITQGRAPSDSEALTDTAVIDQGKAPSDTEALTDAATLAQTKGASDAEGLSDTLSVLRGPGLSDNLGITDTTSVTRGPGLSDPEGLTDSVVIASTKSIIDALGMTDTLTLEFSRSIVDAAGTTDSMGVVVPGQSLSDNEGLTDSGFALTSSGSTTDSAGLTDSLTIAITYTVSLTDSAGTTDSMSLIRLLVITDDVGSSDAMGAVKSGSNNISFTDTLGLSDVPVSLTASGSHTNNVGLSDSLLVVLSTLAPSLSDVAGLTDSITATITHTVSLIDTVGITDAGKTTSLGESLSDSVGMVDSMTSQLIGGVRSFSDTGGLTDTVLWTMKRTITLVDNVGVRDTMTPTGSSTPGEIYDETMPSSRIVDVLMPTMAMTDLVIWREAMVYRVGVTLGQTLEEVHIDVKRRSSNDFAIRWWDDDAHTIASNLSGKNITISVGDSRTAPIGVWTSQITGNVSRFVLNDTQTDIQWALLAGYVLLDNEVLLAALIHIQP